ncbi:MAG: acetyl-CoA carboxylase carboxyltransferase subunit alpha [Firmicutes bacterium]|nr:acetyl-CoA carboxylase carboxyltransferase subunit alpha [Bacillota bacterium]HOB35692.1 acetyl-CoA carboxylase carboxyltransferase subunit alpha [Bacillota bacterium]HPZ90404.1 acetyl-CoA carboxylase carboxyltransferase subunit alpha [Bacillota bacterium]HQE02502.1 acetyl-CoA carboxylase carboxyltransferase subunit alpha [Bacillota bacterium]
MADFEEQLARLQDKIRDLQAFAREQGLDLRREILALEQKAAELRARMYASLSPWQKVQLARDVRRPTTLDYIDMLFTDFIQLHGDRQYRDDPALVGGIARLEGKPVTVLGHQKGRDTKDNIARNFGMPHPEGYRKALRLMEQAEKFGRPVICFIDTPGAYPGLGAEERGQGEAIARNLRAMAALAVPVLAVVTGEGGSGGALALGVGDALLMLEHAVYSVISPEGCAAILWKDSSRAREAAAALKLTAQDLARLGVADEVIPEPQGGIQKDWQAGARAVKEALVRHLDILSGLSADTLLRRRQRRLAAIGQWREH